MVEFRTVRGHADRPCETWHLAAIEAAELRIEKCVEKLANAIGAEVEAEQPIAIPHAGIVTDHGRGKELVSRTLRIAARNGALWGLEPGALPSGQGSERARNTLPTVVAVHREVPAADGRNGRSGRQSLFKGADVRGSRSGWRVSPVGEHMKRNGNIVCAENLCQCHSMVLVRVNPAW